MICPRCAGTGIIPDTAVCCTADEAIEHYYRSRARGSDTTLKAVALKTGHSYSYLRKAKVTYDKAGKWGSTKAKG